jgi:hypothetical protein
VARETHHTVALHRDGDRLVDRPVPNAEPDPVKLFDQLQGQGRVLVVVVDQLASIGALAVAVARARDIAVAYLPGFTGCGASPTRTPGRARPMPATPTSLPMPQGAPSARPSPGRVG